MVGLTIRPDLVIDGGTVLKLVDLGGVLGLWIFGFGRMLDFG